MIRTLLCSAILCLAPAAAFAGGDCCAKPADAQAVAQTGNLNAEADACAQACEAEAVAVANPDAKAMPVGAFHAVNESCPGSGMPVKAGVESMVHGFTVGFCCNDCKTAFDAKAADEQAAFVVAQVKTTVNANCPGSGMPVAAGKVALYNGFAVGFCCDDCKATWNKSDDAKKTAFIASQHAAENANCPGSGNPINAEVVALYRGHTVGFCCEGCQTKFHAMNDGEKNAIVAGFAMGAETASEGCADCATGECDGSCEADA